MVKQKTTLKAALLRYCLPIGQLPPFSGEVYSEQENGDKTENSDWPAPSATQAEAENPYR